MKKETAHYVLFGFLVLLSCLLFFTACQSDNQDDEEKSAKTETDDDDNDDNDDSDDDDDNNDDDDNDDNDDDVIDDPEMMFLIYAGDIGESFIYKRLSDGNWLQYTLPQIQSTWIILHEFDFIQPDLGYAVGYYHPDKSRCDDGLLFKFDGSSWSNIPIDNPTHRGWNAWGGSFFDEDHGFIVGSQGYCIGPNLPVAMQYDNGTWNDITPSHFTDESPFFDALALSVNSFIAVGNFNYGLGSEYDEGAAFRWDSGVWTEIPIEDPGVNGYWYLWKVFDVPEGDLQGIYTVGMSGGIPNQIGMLFKYNESLNTFEHLYTLPQLGSFEKVSTGDGIMALVGWDQANAAIFTIWNGSSYSIIEAPVIEIASFYEASKVINANEIWVAGAYLFNPDTMAGLIHRYKNNAFEMIYPPTITSAYWKFMDFVILE